MAAPSGFRNKVGAARASVTSAGQALPVLVREAGPGRDAVLNQVLSRFAASSSGVKTADAGEIRNGPEATLVRGRGWTLEVAGDGDVVHYRNLSAFESTGSGVPVEERLGNENAQQLALAFVNNALAGIVKLGDKERIEPWYVAYGMTAGGPAVDGPVEPERRVQAIKVVLTRVIGDIPVVGNGSKITVFMDAGGSPIGFDIDWATYRLTAGSQRGVAPDEAETRVATLMEAKRRPEQTVQDAIVECGYYDPGRSASARRFNLVVCTATH